MKDNKNVKSFGQFNENLNISDVSFSKSEIVNLLDKSDEIKSKLDKHIDKIITPFEKRLESSKSKEELTDVYNELKKLIHDIDERLFDTSDYFMFMNYYGQLLENF